VDRTGERGEGGQAVASATAILEQVQNSAPRDGEVFTGEIFSLPMSKPSPETYERGRGMDAHNQVMREIRAEKDASYDPHEPTRVWLDEDNTPDGVRQSLTIILNTGGCRWARAGGCTMCGYVAESVEGGSVTHEALLDQIDVCLEH